MPGRYGINFPNVVGKVKVSEGVDHAHWKGLEPASLVVNLVPDLWRTARNLWWLIPAFLVGGGAQNVANIGSVLFFFLISVGRTIGHFLTLRYRMEGGRLEITEGLFFRRHRLIDPTRIQHMEIVRNLFHRMAGLVELRIDTAGEGGAEGMLSAISEAEAKELQQALARQPAGPASVDTPPPELKNGVIELLGYGFSSGRIGAALVAVSLGMEVLTQLSPSIAGRTAGQLGPKALLGLMLIGVAGSFLLAIAEAFRRYYGFALSRTERGFATEAGLFTRTRIEIPLKKIQMVRVEEPWIRRIFGFGTIQVETAGTFMPTESTASEAMVPMVPQEGLAWAVSLALPGLDIDPWQQPLSPAAPAALMRHLLGGSMRWLLIGGAFSVMAHSPLPMLLFPIGPITAYFDWRQQGWALTPEALISRRGFFERRTTIILRKKVQSVHLVQDPFLRMVGLARVAVWVAGSELLLPDLHEAEARRIFDTLRGE